MSATPTVRGSSLTKRRGPPITFDPDNDYEYEYVDSDHEETFGVSITFSHQVETRTGMLRYGKSDPENAMSCSDLRVIAKRYTKMSGREAEYVDLTAQLPEEIQDKVGEASVLILRGFLSQKKSEATFDECLSYEWDNRFLYMGDLLTRMYLRRNMCYGYKAIEFNAEEKTGTMKHWDTVPLLRAAKQRLQKVTKTKGLLAEGNFYDTTQHHYGIRPHGDYERYSVMCLRLGAKVPLMFWCFDQYGTHRAVHIDPIEIDLNDGDVYIMSAKAVGNTTRDHSRYIYKHAAGSPNITNLYSSDRYVAPEYQVRNRRRR